MGQVGLHNGESDISKNPSAQLNYVVGVGASAGGLEAIKEFFDNIPGNINMSFIIVQHLSPHHKSLMNELLSKHTSMTISAVESGMPVKPDTIYLNRNDKNIYIKNGRFSLLDKSPANTLNLPIDILFHSLGQEFAEKSIAIVLSGTGSDGSRGLKTIKEMGGTIMVQDPETAQFNGMPSAAINTNFAEVIAGPGELARKIMLLPHLYARQIELDNNLNARVFTEILALIRKNTGIDFRFYKEATLLRRLKKRMDMLGYGNLAQYLALLRKSSEENDRLYKDFLIGVTSFFRDKEAFHFIRESVYHELLRDMKPAETIRIWVPGCSTGEEAYTIAMILDAYLAKINSNQKYKIFATDIDRHVLLRASTGVFPVNIINDVPEEFLYRYFIKLGDEFQVVKKIRERIIFSQHNLLSDPPFIRISFISCRNVMIYFNQSAQKRVLEYFHYSLHYRGILFLGHSENIGGFTHVFEVLNSQWRVFRNARKKKVIPAPFSLEPDNMLVRHQKTDPNQVSRRSRIESDDNRFEKILLAQYTPSCIFLDNEYNILYSRGNVRSYLEVKEGKFSSQLLDMLSPDLAIIVRNGIRKVRDSSQPVVFGDVVCEMAGNRRLITLKIMNIPEQIYGTRVFLLEFSEKEISEDLALTISGQELGSIEKQRLDDLESELQRINDEKQSVVEDLETSNEELQASNEELMASNEELQSTNEELQSVNEELYSVNTELQAKNRELENLTLDIDNLLISTQIGTLFLDRNLKVRKFTPELKKVFHLEEHDIGRSIHDFASNFVDITSKEILNDASEVMEKRTPVFREIRSVEGRVYYKRITPYLRKGNNPDGVVLTFIDITKIHQAERELFNKNKEIQAKNEELRASYTELQRINQELSFSEKRFKDIFEQAAVGMAYLGFDGKIKLANDEFLRILGYDRREMPSLSMQSITPREELEKEMELFNSIFTGKRHNYNIEKQAIRRDGELIWLKVTNSISSQKPVGRDLFIISIITDITARKKAAARINRITEDLQQVLESITDGFMVLDQDFCFTLFNHAAEVLLDKPRDEVLGKHFLEAFPEAVGSTFVEKYQHALRERKHFKFEAYFDTEPYENWYSVQVYPNPGGGVSIFFQIVTDQKRYQQMMEGSLKEKDTLLREIHHRIKNNLQIVSSLINLQRNRTGDEQLQNFLLNLGSRIQSMSLIHKILYESERLSKIDFKAYLKSLVANLQSVYRRDMEFVFAVDGILLSIDIAIPLALIVNEAVSNSFKYAFSLEVKGRIVISLQEQDSGYKLRLRDNGPGFPRDFRAGNSDTLGILLIRNLVEQISGEISFFSSGGAVLEIFFPRLDNNSE